jgi:hypothetical protein
MTTYRNTVKLPRKAKPSRTESVKYSDGMIVTADDLQASQRYPSDLLATVLHAYFGSGILCGLGLRRKDDGSKDPTWVVCVDRGVAIDCAGHPIELCGPIELDLSPDACACEEPPDEVCIAVRRMTSEEAPKDTCGCDTDEPRFDCRRIRDNILVQVFTTEDFEALPYTIPELPAPAPPTGDWNELLCDDLKSCASCGCGDCWILLGRVKLAAKTGAAEPDLTDRRWVKPIRAICPGLVDRVVGLEKQNADLIKRTTDLADRVTALEAQAKATANP